MKSSSPSPRHGFTLIETVIAIGVLAVLLTGFLTVFAPAAAGIRKSINVDDADRLASAVEQELATLRTGQAYTTGFDKAFDWIQNNTAQPLLAYQYRGTTVLRNDGTPTPVTAAALAGTLPGTGFAMQPMLRRKSDTANLNLELAAIDGSVYWVKCTPLVFSAASGGLAQGSLTGSASAYPQAVIAVAADFYLLPSKSATYVQSAAFNTFVAKPGNPVFSRNMAIRR
jgi:prepilin-type N-terminal cleavage/methylation domain-containing protein